MGTALAVRLAAEGHRVAVLATAFDTSALDAFRAGREHPAIGVPLPEGVAVHPHDDWDGALAAAEILFVAVATVGLVPTVRETVARARDDALWCVATKGWDAETLRPASEQVAEEVGDPARVVAVVGPSLAAELARGVPTALVCACPDAAAARRVAGVLDGAVVRAFVSEDVAGVEVGGALKNVIAIGVGICEGLGEAFGVEALSNTAAFVFSRGLVEMAQLSRALGGRVETVLGLAGAGDLFVTCLGGRNARFGRLLGRGLAPREALDEMRTTVEGYVNARAAVALADRHGLGLPVARTVAEVLYEGLAPRDAVERLIGAGVEPEVPPGA